MNESGGNYIKTIEEKLSKFYELLKDKKIIIAFTGGISSTILMKLALKVCAEVMCIFVETRYTSPEDLKAVEIAKYSEEDHPTIKIIERPELSKNILILNSPDDRDFFCKKAIVDVLEEQRLQYGYDLIVDATVLENCYNFFNGKNPFGEKFLMIYNDLQISSEDLVLIAEKNSLDIKRNPEINLLSRFNYNIPITEDLLEAIVRSEKYIKELSGKDILVRVRVIDKEHVIIEVKKKNIHKLLDEKTRKKIFDRLKMFGFKSINIDIGGYRRNNLFKLIK